MAPKKSSIVLNVEQFIRDVEERPAIWNRNFHCNKAFLEQMWDELSTEHKLPKVVLKAKWKGLRDNFRVEYKRIPRTESGDFVVDPSIFESKWIHYYALLFLTEHMRHRMPKNEQDQNYYFAQQSQDCEEKTVVEPDLTNGLIRRMQDSDEEFDEDDVDEDDEETQPAHQNTPPAAHSSSVGSSASTAIIKTEDARSLLKGVKSILKAHASMLDDDADKEAQDLSKKSADALRKSPSISSNAITSSSCCSSLSSLMNNPLISMLTPSSTSTPLSSSSSASMAVAAAAAAVAAASQQQHHKKRSVSPPPLYNKAHHPSAGSLTSAAVLSKEREEYSALSAAASCLHGSHEHLNFTKHSYANGLIPALKLKRPRLSEDSNFNGSSTMDATMPLVPEDDDYHYLLSLHPYMKQLTAAQKLRIRTKIQKLIFKELYKEDLEETK